jgi:hypothetical protein
LPPWSCEPAGLHHQPAAAAAAAQHGPRSSALRCHLRPRSGPPPPSQHPRLHPPADTMPTSTARATSRPAPTAGLPRCGSEPASLTPASLAAPAAASTQHPPARGTRPAACSPPRRRLSIWNLMAGYFPASLVKTAELDPAGTYIFTCAPHGTQRAPFLLGPGPSCPTQRPHNARSQRLVATAAQAGSAPALPSMHGRMTWTCSC